MNPMRYLDIEPALARAVAAGRPVAVLASARLAGQELPALLAAANASGALWGAVAVRAGKLRIGPLTESLAAAPAAGCRELPVLLASGGSAPLRDAAAMLAAAMVGIPVLAAGPLGEGLAAEDLREDLQTLTHTPAALVCTGLAENIEAPRQLAYLRAKGVPLLGLGVDTLAGAAVDYAAPDQAAAARVLASKWDLGLRGGVLAACAAAPGECPLASAMRAAGALAAAYAAQR